MSDHTTSHRLRNWCFTWNNPPTENIEDTLRNVFTRGNCRYLCAQLERGARGTPHLQGYVEFPVSTRVRRVSALLPHCHLEPRRGSAEEARTYCMKDDTRVAGPFEFGEFGGNQGQRNDMKALYEAIKEGKSQRDLAEEFPAQMIRYTRGVHNLMSLQPAPPPSTFDCALFYGPTGCGKSHTALLMEDAYSTPVSDKIWYDGYDRHKTMVMDDFAGRMSKLPLSDLLRIIDIYHPSVAVKGSFTRLDSEHLILTCNFHPREWYDYSKREFQYPALERRFTRLVVWTADRGPIPLFRPPQVRRTFTIPRVPIVGGYPTALNDSTWRSFWDDFPKANIEEVDPPPQALFRVQANADPEARWNYFLPAFDPIVIDSDTSDDDVSFFSESGEL